MHTHTHTYSHMYTHAQYSYNTHTAEPLYYSPPNKGHLHCMDDYWQYQTVGHWNVYLLHLQIKDTPLFHTTDAWSRPKQSCCMVSERTQSNPMSPAVPHRSWWWQLVYETRMPDIKISPSPLGLLLLVWCRWAPLIDECGLSTNLRTKDTSIIRRVW